MGGIRSIEMPTGKSTLLAVELPNDESSYFRPNGTYTFDGVNYQYIGTLDQMTEEVWKGIVDKSIHTELLAHYVEGINPPNAYCHKTDTESGLSLLKANGADKLDRNLTHFFIKTQ